MESIIQITVIIIAVALTFIILLQTRGSGGLGGIFGGTESSGFRTRRGVEATLYKFTIVLGVIFVAVCAVSARIGI